MKEEKFVNSYLANVKQIPETKKTKSYEENIEVIRNEDEFWDDWSEEHVKNVESTNDDCVWGDGNISMSNVEYHQPKFKKKLFCSCGHSFYVSLKFKKKVATNFKEETVIIKDEQSFHTITCRNCNKEYNNFDNLLEIGMKLYENIIDERFLIYSDEEKIKITKINRYIGVNLHSEKLFFKETKKHLVYNKKTKRFYLIDNVGVKCKNKIFSFGLRCSKEAFMRNIQPSLRHKVCYYSLNKNYMIKNIEQSCVKPLNNILNLFLQEIDERDRSEIKSMIDDSFLSKEKINELRLKDHKSISNFEREILSNYFDALSLVTSIIQFPQISTVLFTKGFNFFKELNSFNILPNASLLKRKNETKPKKIIEDIIIKTVYQSYNEYKTFSKTYEQIDDYDITINRLKKRKKNILNFSLSKNLFQNINCKDDLYCLSMLGSLNNFDSNFFQSICDKYGEREVLEMTSSFYLDNSFYDNKIISEKAIDFNKKIFSHLMKVFSNSIKKDEAKLKISHSLEDYRNRREIRKRQFNSRIYKDAINMIETLEISDEILYECNTSLEVYDLHDDLTERIKLVKLEKYNENIKIFTEKFEHVSKNEIDNIEFTLIDSIKGLEKESSEMNHCVRSYARGLSEGRVLIFSLYDKNTNERGTLELRNSIDGWVFSQLKGKRNIDCSFKMCKSTVDFMEILNKKDIKCKFSESNYDLRNFFKKEENESELSLK